MTTEVTVKRRNVPVYGFKVLEAKSGIFSAFVAVFNNVDYADERIKPGFFAKSLDRWRQASDPVPCIFSHQWDNLYAHVGLADPNDIREMAPGSPGLPEELKTLGALYVAKSQLDVEEDGPAGDMSRALFKRMERRSIKEFSFAFDVTASELADDGAVDLIEGDLIEFGPTLKGMNPLTELVGTRSRITTVDPTKKAPADGAKVWAQLRGSDEERRDALQDAARAAFGLDGTQPGSMMSWMWVCVEAVFDDYCVVSVDDYDGDTDYWQMPFTFSSDGTVTFGPATPVALSVVMTPTTIEADDPTPTTGVARSSGDSVTLGYRSIASDEQRKAHEAATTSTANLDAANLAMEIAAL